MGKAIMTNEIVFDLEIQRAINTDKFEKMDGKYKCSIKGFEDYYTQYPQELEDLKKNGFNNIEVAGWSKINKTLISYGVIFDYATNKIRVYDESNVSELIDRINNADKVIGFNHINFDYTVLSQYGQINPSAIRDYDIMQKLQSKVGKKKGTGLDAVAEATIGKNKTDDGADAPGMWLRGEHARLINYCMDDVLVTKDLYEFIVDKGYVIFNGDKVTI